jgi:hypothetical protein
MSKKHFIDLADMIRDHNKYSPETAFSQEQIEALASFCRQQNPAFMRARWLEYIAGECGKNGGKVKAA